MLNKQFCAPNYCNANTIPVLRGLKCTLHFKRCEIWITLDHLSTLLNCQGENRPLLQRWVVIELEKADKFSTDYEKQNDWKEPRARAPMTVSDLTTYVESMQGSVFDLSCSLRRKPAPPQFTALSSLPRSSFSPTFLWSFSCFDEFPRWKLCGRRDWRINISLQ